MSALHNTKIVSLAVNLPGPLLVSRLREFGADVTKVEPPQGDPLGNQFPDYYKELVSGQKVLKLNLTDAEAQDQLSRLLSDSDVLITSSRKSSLLKLGLDWSQLRARFPRLIHVALISFPGERANQPAHDLNFQAEQGFIVPPNLPVTCWADIAGAQEGVIRVFAALQLRGQMGAGSYEEVALSESLRPFFGPMRHKLTGATDRLLGGLLPEYGLYEAADGWIALAALEEHLRTRVEVASGVSPLARPGLISFFSSAATDHWVMWGEKNEIPISRVR